MKKSVSNTAAGVCRRAEWYSIALLVSALVPFGLLMLVMEREPAIVVLSFVGLVFGYLGWSYYVTTRNTRHLGVFSVRTLAIVLVAYFVGAIVVGWIPPSVIASVHAIAIALVFIYYWFITLAALYHYQSDRSATDPTPPFPSISVLVPAYNEEGYIGRTIQAVLDAEYPRDRLEIIVVDDGSTDDTYREAIAYESETVSVVRKENGGKYSALNYGLLFASGEVIVTVDADSIVDTTALKRIVAPFDGDPNVGAVTSDVTIWNRDSLVTRCQQLEYTIGANIYRRMLDLFGVVLIVPGCLGAFRREAIESVFAYDPETLTEDFDLTVKVLREGYRVTASDARVYTEAPGTWTDLYHQRLRWYRGNYMTVLKHLDIVRNPSYGFLNRIAFPLRLVEMFFLPLASWVILAVIVWLALSGAVAQLVAPIVVFASIVFLIAALGVHIGGENWRLIAYTPLFVVGYKHFHDLVAVKSLLDVLFGRDLEWTRPERAEQKVRERATEEAGD